MLTHALHYGSGVFEGIRAYKTARGAGVFRLTDHIKRLERSAKLYYMPVPLYARAAGAGHQRRGRSQRACRPATSARSCFAGTARWASSRSTPRSTWRSPPGRGARTWAMRASSTVSAPRSRASSRSTIRRWRAPPRPRGQYLNSILAKVEVVERRLRRGHHAQRARPRGRGFGREHLLRARRRAHDAAA